VDRQRDLMWLEPGVLAEDWQGESDGVFLSRDSCFRF